MNQSKNLSFICDEWKFENTYFEAIKGIIIDVSSNFSINHSEFETKMLKNTDEQLKRGQLPFNKVNTVSITGIIFMIFLAVLLMIIFYRKLTRADEVFNKALLEAIVGSSKTEEEILTA